ncbi:MAG: oxidoreductase family protein, partial [Verrucomicrobiota bacterium]
LDALDWMPTTNYIEADYEDNWASFKKHYGHFIEDGGVDLGNHLLPYIDWVFAEIEHRPKTITHNDLREDNLLFGAEGTAEEVIIIDWQLTTRSMGVFDVTRLMSGSTLPDLRRGHEIEILKIWHDALLDGGVEDYSWDDARYDLHLALLECICYPIKFHTAFIDKPHEGRGYQLTEAIIRRHFASAVDLNAAEILPN